MGILPIGHYPVGNPRVPCGHPKETLWATLGYPYGTPWAPQLDPLGGPGRVTGQLTDRPVIANRYELNFSS